MTTASVMTYDSLVENVQSYLESVRAGSGQYSRRYS